MPRKTRAKHSIDISPDLQPTLTVEEQNDPGDLREVTVLDPDQSTDSSNRSRSRRKPHHKRRRRSSSNERSVHKRRSKRKKTRHHKRKKSRHARKNKHHRRRHCSSSSSDSSSDSSDYSSGESVSNYSSDLDQNNFVPPTTAFGSCVGTSVKKSLIKKIRNDEYIDFSDLLPFHDFEDTHNLGFEPDFQNGTLKIIKKQPKKSLTFFQWAEAFDQFSVIYLKEHPQKTASQTVDLAQQLFTYRKSIADLFKMNADWYTYDKHFRTEMKSRREAWSSIRFDLHMLYKSNLKSKPQPQKSAYHPNKFGVCFLYNDPSARCQNLSCKYFHVCSKCRNNHPQYLCRKFSNNVTSRFPAPANGRFQYDKK